MRRMLRILIIGSSCTLIQELEGLIRDYLKDYHFSFATCVFENLSSLDFDPDFIFVVEKNHLTNDMVAQIRSYFPRKIYVVVTDREGTKKDHQWASQVDEIISFEELNSGIGQRFLGSLVTLRELASAQILIEESEERFKGIIEHSHEVIVLLDEEGTVIYISPAFTRLLGYESWEVLGQSFFSFLDQGLEYAFKGQLHKLVHLPAEEPRTVEYRFRSKSGDWLHFESIVSNLLKTDSVRAIVLNARDVTQQKMIERELEKYHRHLEALVASRTREVEKANKMAATVVATSPASLMALDEEGYITFASENYRQDYPRSTEALSPGRHIMEAWEAMAKEAKLSMKDPSYQEMKSWFSHPKDKEPIEFRRHTGAWVRLSAQKIPDGGGVVIATMDISEYKRQQALLAAQSAKLAAALVKEREVTEQQRTFISMVSHEFRTPLAIIDGNAQIIQKRGVTLDRSMLENRANVIRLAVERLVRLIETILSAHMVESGKMTVSLAPGNLDQVLQSLILEQQSISPKHRFVLHTKDLDKETMIDEKIIRHIMTNLLSNAVKYSPDAEIIEVDAREEENTVKIQVKDQGIGIPAEELPRLFQRYFRASTALGMPGSGIGLSLVKQCVELLKGQISVESVVGQGTTVTTRFPVNIT